jgi:putative phage-type endonuclease
MQLIQLDDLINIIDEIEIDVKDDLSLIYSESTFLEFTETIHEIMYQYLLDHPTFITDPMFDEDFKDIIWELICIPFEQEFFWNPLLKEEMEEILDEIMDDFFELIIPCRSYPSSIIISLPNIESNEKQINYLRSKPQPDQRTKEWYEFRNNLITASNAYKAFENENTRNQLIYEKCNVIKPENTNSNNFININTTLHWGQKYEKVSVMIYEYIYKTIIEDFGCIQHDNYKFIGASPDGINILKQSSRYGRMLEIKNIINREIDGIPKKEYWIQMQLQMEVCNLDECDFLETKFIEYENYHDYINDIYGDHKGVIMYFAKPDGSPFYVYRPIDMLDIDSDKWEDENRIKYNNLNMTWIKNCYWKLEKLSCVLVLRNKQWFKDNISQLEYVWSVIEKERITGFEHREPNKRMKKDMNESLIVETKGCLLSLNKDDNKISIQNNNNSNNNTKVIEIKNLEMNNNIELWKNIFKK